MEAEENRIEEPPPPGSSPSSQLPNWRTRATSWVKGHRTQIKLLGIGFLCGALVIQVRSCGEKPASQASHGASPEEARQGSTWTCSMHPQIRQKEPGACPICGMDLIPVGKGDAEGDAAESPEQITLSARAMKLAELRTSVVRRRSDSTGAVRLLGRIEPNEATLKTVTAWTGGRIDRLFVNTTGETVKSGQVIATLYSPEVFAAHQDLITATAQVEKMAGGVESSRKATEAALNASRQRLRLLGVPEWELTHMAKQDKPTTAVPIRTPFGGTVMERFATEGTYVQTGARLYSIANLTDLWIQLDAYESDLPLLSLNQSVRVEVEAYPGEDFDGTVTFIEPTLNAQKRTARVRVEVENKDGRLRPGMFAQAIVATESKKGPDAPLVIPSTAPLFTGRRAIVYVDVKGEGGTYEARTVRLGPRLGNVYPVVAGLSEGERIVTRGAFALDADLQIRGGNSMMFSPDDEQPGEWDGVIHVGKESLRNIAPVIAEYLSVQRSLADDELALSQAAAAKMVEELKTANLDSSPEAKRAWDHFSKMLAEDAKHIVQADSIEHARRGFEGLSGAVVMVLRVLGNPLDITLRQAHCPMARGSQGGSWIQEGEEVDNSYFGESMLTCGDITAKIAPGAHLRTPEDKATRPPAAAPAGEHNH